MNRLLLVLVSGIIMGLAPPPFFGYYLAFFALIPLWITLVDRDWLISKRDDKFAYLLAPARSPLVLGAIWGLGYHGLALFWITGIHPMTWMGVPWLASLLIAGVCWLIITAWGMVLVMLWAGGLAKLCDQLKIQGEISLKASSLRLLLGVMLWCLLENLWSRGILWWSSLALTQSPNNLFLLQFSQFSGFITVTAILVFFNGLGAEVGLYWLHHRRAMAKNGIILYFAVILTVIGIGNHLFHRPVAEEPSEKITIGIIQGNIPNEIKLYPEGWRNAIAGYTKGYQKLARSGVDIVLTPETALPYRWRDIVANSAFYQAILAEKTPVWLGAFGEQGNHLTNSLLTVTGDGKIYSQFDKVKLVPLGEYIPFSRFFGQFINRLSPLEADLVPGDDQQIFSTPLGRVAVGICYESAFAEHFHRQVAQGAEFIISAANNAHYSTAMPAQHHAQDVIRAIESDRWLARATNTGYSAIINPRGQTIWKSKINHYELHSGVIYRQRTQTLFVAWGDWLTPVLVVLSGITCGLRYQRLINK